MRFSVQDQPSSLDTRVVCLHGLGRAPADWDGVRPELARFGDVVTPRIPSSPKRALDVIDAVITPASIVIGHSIGAGLAMRLAQERPVRLRAAILTGGFFAPARVDGLFGRLRRAPDRVRKGLTPLADHHVPIDYAIASSRRHAGWSLEVLDRGGHHAHVTEPRLWTAAVTSWLDENLEP
jgi:pimeloyl-ACP methyl ester carboxylesterase